ncbi:MAG: hypothetical protein WBF75_07485 [Pseudonocardiaceae bacterium]
MFTLIAGRQQPHHTTGLYKIAGQRCGEVSGHAPLRAFVRCVQSNFAYSDGRLMTPPNSLSLP